MRQIANSVAPPIRGLSSQGTPNHANGVSRSAKPGQYADTSRPSADASMNQRTGGTSLGTNSAGLSAMNEPRAKTRPSDRRPYSAIGSGGAPQTSNELVV